MKLETLGGLWRSEQAIHTSLCNIKSEKDKINALYIQLQFHHLVLSSVSPKSFYFQKSHSEKGKKVDFDPGEMMQHLIEIVKMSLNGTEQPFYDSNNDDDDAAMVSGNTDINLKSSSERDEEFKKQKEGMFYKLKAASMKRSADKSKRTLDYYIMDVNLLVGKKVKHKVQETSEEIPEWFDATVLRIDRLSKELIQTRYDIYYDVDGQDTIYSFPLLTDLKRGNLIIME